MQAEASGSGIETPCKLISACFVINLACAMKEACRKQMMVPGRRWVDIFEPVFVPPIAGPVADEGAADAAGAGQPGAALVARRL